MENKKNLIIGVLIGIIIGLIVALICVCLVKKNDSSDKTTTVSTTTKTTTTTTTTTTAKKEVVLKKSGYYVLKTEDTWYGLQLKNGNKARVVVNPCPGQACGAFEETGSYKKDGDKLTVTLTESIDDIGESFKLDKPVVWELVIINENTLKMDEDTLKYNKDFN